LIEEAYVIGPQLGRAVWTEDEAGPYQTAPYAGESWHPAGQPLRLAHEYLRNGTAKLLVLFEPSSGHARVQGGEFHGQRGAPPLDEAAIKRHFSGFASRTAGRRGGGSPAKPGSAGKKASVSP
jgi:hypothetical protein